MNTYENASNGLNKMYIASIGAIVCAILMYIPFVNIFVAIVAIGFAIYNLTGYYSAGKDIAGCKVAFGLQIAYIIIYVMASASDNVTAITETLIQGIPSLAIVVVIFSTAGMLRNLGEITTYDQGIRSGWIVLICNIVVIIATINVYILQANGAIGTASIISMFSAIFSILALVYQVRFLKASMEAFRMYNIKKTY